MAILSKLGEELTVLLEGRLDVNTAEPVEAKILANIDGIKHLIIDCGKLNYVSSAGLRILVSLQKRLVAAGGDMKLLKVGRDVMDIFEITGFNDFLTIEKS